MKEWENLMERVSADLNLPSFTHPYSFLHRASALLPSFSFTHCADPYDPVGCYGLRPGIQGDRKDLIVRIGPRPTSLTRTVLDGLCPNRPNRPVSIRGFV